MGQSKQKRDCPAAGQGITPAECGSKRISHYACLETCPFNPWNPENRESMQEIENHLLSKQFKQIATWVDQSQVDQVIEEFDESPDIAFDFFLRHLYRDRDANGKTGFERWQEKNGLNDLNNDEKVLIQHQSQVRMTVFEILTVLDNNFCLAKDRLDPAAPPFWLHDPDLPPRVVRFSLLLGMLHPLPHYRQPFGPVIDIPDVGILEAEKIVRATAGHLGAPMETAALRTWLEKNLNLMAEAFLVIAKETRLLMLKKLELQMNLAQYAYVSDAARDELASRLARCPDFSLRTTDNDDGIKRWIWQESETLRQHPENPWPPPTLAELGLVRLLSEKVYLETSHDAMLPNLRREFEKLADGLLLFVDEASFNLAEEYRTRQMNQLNRNLMPPDLAICLPALPPIPPDHRSGDMSGNTLDASPEAFHRSWLEKPLDELDNRSAREAAADPLLRPKLVSLLKSITRTADLLRQEDGHPEFCSWMIKALGLSEIDFPPPPPRPPEPDEEWDEDWDEDWDDATISR